MPGFFDSGNADALGLLGSGIQGFAKGLMDVEERNERQEDRKFKRLELEAKMKADQEERTRKQAEEERKGFSEVLDARKIGVPVPAGAKSFRDIDPSAPLSEEYKQRQELQAMQDPYGLKGLQVQNAKMGLLKSQEEMADKARKKATSPLPGYQKGPDYMAGPAEEKALREGYADVQKFNNTLDRLKARVQGASKRDLIDRTSDTYKAIQNDLRDLQLIYKGQAFAGLGVLTGPDLGLLEQVIENPGSLSNLYSGKEGVLSRYEQMKSKVTANMDAKAKTYGLIPSMQSAPRDGETKEWNGKVFRKIGNEWVQQ